jgi:hypothetical protein
MNLAEWKNAPVELKGMRAYHKARKHFSLCKIKGVVLHHKVLGCTNYEDWNINELIPMFKWCHSTMHHRGKIFSEESRKKMSESHKGQVPWNKGIPCSEEQKLKLSDVFKGKPMHSDTTKKVIAKAMTGKKHSEETKQKISTKKLGHFVSEETKKHMSESAKIAWAKRKAMNNSGVA